MNWSLKLKNHLSGKPFPTSPGWLRWIPHYAHGTWSISGTRMCQALCRMGRVSSLPPLRARGGETGAPLSNEETSVQCVSPKFMADKGHSADRSPVRTSPRACGIPIKAGTPLFITKPLILARVLLPKICIE